MHSCSPFSFNFPGKFAGLMIFGVLEQGSGKRHSVIAARILIIGDIFTLRSLGIRQPRESQYMYFFLTMSKSKMTQ